MRLLQEYFVTSEYWRDVRVSENGADVWESTVNPEFTVYHENGEWAMMTDNEYIEFENQTQFLEYYGNMVPIIWSNV